MKIPTFICEFLENVIVLFKVKIKKIWVFEKQGMRVRSGSGYIQIYRFFENGIDPSFSVTVEKFLTT
jgi:hypothetical protein